MLKRLLRLLLCAIALPILPGIASATQEGAELILQEIEIHAIRPCLLVTIPNAREAGIFDDNPNMEHLLHLSDDELIDLVFIPMMNLQLSIYAAAMSENFVFMLSPELRLQEYRKFRTECLEEMSVENLLTIFD